MDHEIMEWLQEEDLNELVEIFTSQKIKSMRRLLALNEELIKELIPQIGLRAGFLSSWKRLISEKSPPSVTITNNTPIIIESVSLSDIPKLSSKISEVSERSEISEGSEISEVPDPEIIVIHSDNHTDSEAQSVLDLDSIQEPQTASTSNLDSIQKPQSASTSNIDLIQDNRRKRFKKEENVCSKSEQNRYIVAFQAVEELTALDFEKVIKNHCLRCNVALQNYNKKGMLTDLNRSAITEAVANAILQLNHLPTASEYNIAANKLCELFPCETKESYYCPPVGKYRNASGKLPDKVKNIKYQLKKKGAGSWATSRSESFVPSDGRITHPAKLTGSCDPNDSTIKTAIAHLKYNTEPWPELLRSWSVTHPLRFNYLKETRPIETQKGKSSVQQLQESAVLVSDYFKNWPVLAQPNGYLLIQQDFKDLYPGREDGLISKWDSMKEILIDFLNAEITNSDGYGTKLLADLTTDPDTNDVILFHLLPSLCCKRTRGASVGTPSVAEARKAFILHVSIPGDLNRQIKTHSEYLAKHGLNLQPMLIFVGPTLANITASYVQINTVRYQLRTPLNALDICFKAFYALDAAYPKECRAVWLFIQKYFYDIYLKEDLNIPRVTSILSSLKGLMSKKI